MTGFEIIPYTASHKDSVLALTVDAWTPVFSKTWNDVPRFVLEAFYPNGWQTRQTSEIEDLLRNEPENTWLAMLKDALVGFVGLRLHPDDQMGEIYIIGVSPDHQRMGISTMLMQHAENEIRASGAQSPSQKVR
ncbi:MAG: GNAT family N-acetyltransferase [Pseudomonadota bacterium]